MHSKKTTVERRKFIINEVTSIGQVYVHELSEKFNVSEVTVRNDLEQLEKKKILIRARGGAIKYEGSVIKEQMLSDKDKLHMDEKIRIGKKAASLIQEKDTIILDSGSTTTQIARNIPEDKDLTIITNALHIANELVSHPGINLIMLGGYLRPESLCMVGFLAENNLRNFFVDKVFLGVDGFDTSHGAFTPNMEEAHLNQIMIQNAKEVIIVADSTKFVRKSFAFICELKVISTIITDDGISDEDKSRLEEAGVKVIIA